MRLESFQKYAVMEEELDTRGEDLLTYINLSKPQL